MATPVVNTMVSVLAVSLLSLIGALSLMFGALRRHGVMMFLVALAAGTLLGDAFLHLLPEATAESGGLTTNIAGYVIAGFMVMFVLEITLRLEHAHGELTDPIHGVASTDPDKVKPFGLLNLVGDGVHNLIDGVVIAAAFLVDFHVGVATTIAVALHEIPQELGDFAVLVRAGFSRTKALMLNLGTALLALLGAAIVLWGPWSPEGIQRMALPLISGAFLYIAAADLIPELHHHNGRREAMIILAGLLLGIGAMYGILGLEGTTEAGHAHD